MNEVFQLETPIDQGRWRERARCKEAPPGLFEEVLFRGPVKYVPVEIEDVARKFCRHCPVLARCRDEADANPTLTGVLGGQYRTWSKSQKTYRIYDILGVDPSVRRIVMEK